MSISFFSFFLQTFYGETAYDSKIYSVKEAVEKEKKICPISTGNKFYNLKI